MSYIDEENFSGLNSGTPSRRPSGEGIGFFATLAIAILVLVGLVTLGFFTQETNTDLVSFLKFAKAIVFCGVLAIVLLVILFGALVLFVLMLNN